MKKILITIFLFGFSIVSHLVGQNVIVHKIDKGWKFKSVNDTLDAIYSRYHDLIECEIPEG